MPTAEVREASNTARLRCSRRIRSHSWQRGVHGVNRPGPAGYITARVFVFARTTGSTLFRSHITVMSEVCNPSITGKMRLDLDQFYILRYAVNWPIGHSRLLCDRPMKRKE